MINQNNKKIMAENIQYYLDLKKIKPEAICSALNIEPAVLTDWLTEKNYPNLMQIRQLAEFFEVERSDLTRFKVKKTKINKSITLPQVEGHSADYPLLKQLIVNEPIMSASNYAGYVKTHEGVGADFCITVKGDAMRKARINDGYTAFVKYAETVEDGKIGAVLIDKRVIIRRIIFKNVTIILTTEDPEFPDMEYAREALDRKEIRIIGQVVAVQFAP